MPSWDFGNEPAHVALNKLECGVDRTCSRSHCCGTKIEQVCAPSDEKGTELGKEGWFAHPPQFTVQSFGVHQMEESEVLGFLAMKFDESVKTVKVNVAFWCAKWSLIVSGENVILRLCRRWFRWWRR